MTKKFKSPLSEARGFTECRQALERKQGPAALSGCLDSELVHMAVELTEGYPIRLLVAGTEQKAAEMAEDAACFGEDTVVFPAKDLLFYQADVSGKLITARRMSAIKHIVTEGRGLVITTIDSLLERLRPAELVLASVIEVESGSVTDMEALLENLAAAGFERVPQVEGRGQFSVRGGIVDVYPLTDEFPIRIEFWDDEVDSIRTFDPETQRSVDSLEQAVIYPANEAALRAKGEEVSFLDYLPADVPVLLDDPARLYERALAVTKEYQESMVHRLEEGYSTAEDVPVLYSVEEVFEMLSRPRTVALTGIGQASEGFKPKLAFTVQAQTVPSYQGQFMTLVADLKGWKKEKARVVLLAGSSTRAKRLAADLLEYDVDAIYTEEPGVEAIPGRVLVLSGNLHKGFGYPMLRFYVISEGDLFGRKAAKRRRAAQKEGTQISDYTELSVGDYVIHENHGLGLYNGTTRIERNGVTRDYMKITYGDGGVLYIPVTQMNLVRKYADKDADHAPKLNHLAGNEWHRTKTRVKRAVQEIAEDLVRLYAVRAGTTRHAYGPDTVWQREFEEQFPYEETRDQIAAIEATKADMESDKIMDRLICGDVGFGKTEIAIRAAFKAVQEGRQVAYLVPTTILAQQHYNTFRERLQHYPVTIELLCRFKTAAEQKKTVEELKRGMADIVIGTHRLLSKDVGFKNLGLLVIDEEQRFGVADKEKIKKLKEDVDVLSLTATPIPRTLHMSLIGVRDMSVLKEAPIDRLPIQTYVMEYHDEIVREAIERELARNGQVYFVYNKVHSIADMTAHVQQLVPQARVAFAHGQMKEHELEQIMLDFINGDIDVLVSTTIVETGLDISNVNTILIHDADRFGLAQLYQLRGRVGRSNRTAYAFLFYRRDRMLKETAEKRLMAIREYTELGSGIRIAMRDLELRGAGTLLGAEQHGNMEAVGYDLYCKLLGIAVKEAKGEKRTVAEFETAMDLDIDAFLPENYIKNETQRLNVYQRIAGIETDEDLMDMQDELIDRFGEVPKSTQQLLRAALVKAKAHRAWVEEIAGNVDSVRFVINEKAPVDTAAIAPLLARYRGNLKVSLGGKNSFVYTDRKKELHTGMDLLARTEEIVTDIAALMTADTEA